MALCCMVHFAAVDHCEVVWEFVASSQLRFQDRTSSSSPAFLFVPSGCERWPAEIFRAAEELLRLALKFIEADAIERTAVCQNAAFPPVSALRRRQER